ncbi:hypothetical protein HN954_00990 [bacterium]|jgi:hypothetical protein|nr:hypothetical protein [bacterium]MBT6831779.1 hypothetical protein [bacterium]MBT6995986.1 hypothetical protein [bacterium]MBT7772643.1 hypothetical protein [bacterium]
MGGFGSERVLFDVGFHRVADSLSDLEKAEISVKNHPEAIPARFLKKLDSVFPFWDAGGNVVCAAPVKNEKNKTSGSVRDVLEFVVEAISRAPFSRLPHIQ